MTVKIRLKRTGRKKDAHYKVVAVDSRKKRDGSVLEYLGHYHPQDSFPNLTVDLERYKDFKRKGAQVSDTVRTLINKLQRNFIEEADEKAPVETQDKEDKSSEKVSPDEGKEKKDKPSEEVAAEEEKEKEDLKKEEKNAADREEKEIKAEKKDKSAPAEEDREEK